jgi:hypothetical protein
LAADLGDVRGLPGGDVLTSRRSRRVRTAEVLSDGPKRGFISEGSADRTALGAENGGEAVPLSSGGPPGTPSRPT